MKKHILLFALLITPIITISSDKDQFGRYKEPKCNCDGAWAHESGCPAHSSTRGMQKWLWQQSENIRIREEIAREEAALGDAFDILSEHDDIRKAILALSEDERDEILCDFGYSTVEEIYTQARGTSLEKGAAKVASAFDAVVASVRCRRNEKEEQERILDGLPRNNKPPTITSLSSNQ